MFAGEVSWDGHEGPRPRVTIAPGAVGVRRPDLARRERTAERAAERHRKDVDELAAELAEHGEFLPDPPSRREITEWSRKSRANMTLALCEIDFTGMLNGRRVPAMVTLTYPGDWLVVAPNGRTVKEHLDEFRRRWRRAWGYDLDAVWKLEFQARGAPHFHLLVVPPHGTAHSRTDAAGAGLAFRPWLSAVWADIVDHPDPVQYVNHLRAGTGVDYSEGLKAKDPKRLSVYFTKHGSFAAKEYQHIVPEPWREPGEGPGRFWGYWQLRRTVYGVELPPEDAVTVARTIRRWARAQGTTRQVRAARTKGGRIILPRGEPQEVIGLAGALLVASRRQPRYRAVRRRVNRLSRGAGWVSVNDGARFAAKLAQYLRQLHDRARNTVEQLLGDRMPDAP